MMKPATSATIPAITMLIGPPRKASTVPKREIAPLTIPTTLNILSNKPINGKTILVTANIAGTNIINIPAKVIITPIICAIIG